MKRKTQVILPLIIGLLLFLPGCNDGGSNASSGGENAAVTENNTAEDTNAGTSNKEIQITVEPPAGWEPVEGSVLPVQYMKGSASFMVKNEAFPGDTIDEVVEAAKGSFESAFENVQYSGNTETITVDGKDARKLIFTCDVSGMPMKYEYVYLFAGSKVYAITFGDLAETFDSLAADYETILENITFE